MGDIASGIFALSGTLVGGFASWAGTRADAKARGKQAAVERLDKSVEMRRVLYTAFLKHSYLVTDLARDVLRHEHPSEVSADTKARYDQAWQDLVQARADVEVVGPRDASTAARTLFEAVAGICNQADKWYDSDKPTWGDAADKLRTELLKTLETARQEFVTTVQQIVAKADGSAGD